MSKTKATNPKQALGDAKAPLDLIPDTALVEENLAFLEGALKYGGYNYRVFGVRVSTYVKAARRHLAKFWNGQDRDPITRVMELASVRACCGILIDGIIKGNITDDRPPRIDLERQLKEAEAVVAHLKELFKNHNPPQYTEREHGFRAATPIAVPPPPLLCSTPIPPYSAIPTQCQCGVYLIHNGAVERADRSGRVHRLGPMFVCDPVLDP